MWKKKNFECVLTKATMRVGSQIDLYIYFFFTSKDADWTSCKESESILSFYFFPL